MPHRLRGGAHYALAVGQETGRRQPDSLCNRSYCFGCGWAAVRAAALVSAPAIDLTLALLEDGFSKMGQRACLSLRSNDPELIDFAVFF